MAAATKERSSFVDLGFAEYPTDEEWFILLSHFFPHKIGGKPAWLSFKSIPAAKDVQCKICTKPCVFLMQIYASNSSPSCFHRTLFVFICRDPKCCNTNNSDNFIVFRSQLTRENEFYPVTPADDENFDPDSDYPKAEKYEKLCHVCGIAGAKLCSKCHRTAYCSREHQTLDWKTDHKQACGKTASKRATSTNGLLFPEYEIALEPEDLFVEEEGEVKSEEERIRMYSEFIKSTKVSDKTFTEAELDRTAAGEDKYDSKFEEFKKRIQVNPEQILRYQVGGEPLWVTDKNIPTDAVPPCQYCGAQRQFEFQIMPQLLKCLDVDSMDDSIDWGTLVIYTCSNNCEQGATYGLEHIVKQDFVVS